VEYHNSLVAEGNTVSKLALWDGDVDRLLDLGREIGIIHRYSVRKSGLTGHFDCEFQLVSFLKVERQSFVQVVLLLDTEQSTKVGQVKKS